MAFCYLPSHRESNWNLCWTGIKLQETLQKQPDILSMLKEKKWSRTLETCTDFTRHQKTFQIKWKVLRKCKPYSNKHTTSTSLIRNKHGYSWLKSNLASGKILISLFTKNKCFLFFPINFFIILLQQSPWFDLKKKYNNICYENTFTTLCHNPSQVKEVVF